MIFLAVPNSFVFIYTAYPALEIKDKKGNIIFIKKGGLKPPFFMPFSKRNPVYLL